MNDSLNEKTYLECGLPFYLQESLEEYKASFAKVENGIKDIHFDLYYDGFRSNINVAENGYEISKEQAQYLRDTYL